MMRSSHNVSHMMGQLESDLFQDSAGSLEYSPEVTQNERRVQTDDILFDVVAPQQQQQQGGSTDAGESTDEQSHHDPERGGGVARLMRKQLQPQQQLGYPSLFGRQEKQPKDPASFYMKDGDEEMQGTMQGDEIIWNDNSKSKHLRRRVRELACLSIVILTVILCIVVVSRSLHSASSSSTSSLLPSSASSSTSDKYVLGNWISAVNQDWVGPAVQNPSKPYSGDNYGHLVRLSDDGQQLAVAVSVRDEFAPAETANTGDTGVVRGTVFPAVYVYRPNNNVLGAWTLQHRLEPPSSMIRNMRLPTVDESLQDNTAESMAMSGDGKRIAMTAGDFVLVFEKKTLSPSSSPLSDDGSSWELLDKVLDPWSVGFDDSVLAPVNNHQTTLVFSDDGDTLVVRGVVNNQALVRVFTWQPSSTGSSSSSEDYEWTAFPKDIKLDGEFAVSGGLAVSANGRRVAVGMLDVNAGHIPSAGVVTVYDWRDSDQSWITAGSLIYGTASYQRLGTVLTFSNDGNTLIVSSTNDGGDAAGMVQTYVYSTSHSDWILQFTLQGKSPLENYGAALELSRTGTTLVVGAPGTPMHRVGPDYYANHPDDIMYQLGQVYVYELSSTAATGNQKHEQQEQQPYWRLRSPSAIVPSSPNDGFGTAVAVTADGSRVTAGAPWRATSFSNPDTSVRGAVALFDWHPTMS